jgi:hypothetical protein
MVQLGLIAGFGMLCTILFASFLHNHGRGVGRYVFQPSMKVIRFTPSIQGQRIKIYNSI